MSKGLENLVNINPVSAGYPFGDIKDDTGVGDGTPVDRISHADYHQTFRKFLTDANITPNNLPDNVTNGYQYNNSLNYLYKRCTGVVTVAVDNVFSNTSVRKFVNTIGAVGNVNHSLPTSVNLKDGDSFIFKNDGIFIVSIDSQFAVGGDVFDNLATVFVLVNKGDTVEFILDKPNKKWFVANLRLVTLPLPKAVISAYNTPVANFTFSSTTLLFPNETTDIDNQFTVATGKFKGKTTGVFNFSAIASFTSVFDFSAEPAGGLQVKLELHKNGVATGIFSNVIFRGLSGFCTPIISSSIKVTSIADEYTFVLSTSAIVNITYGGNLSISFVE